MIAPSPTHRSVTTFPLAIADKRTDREEKLKVARFLLSKVAMGRESDAKAISPS